jgi:hypothetical protein
MRALIALAGPGVVVPSYIDGPTMIDRSLNLQRLS